jgi:hypothetical protein
LDSASLRCKTQAGIHVNARFFGRKNFYEISAAVVKRTTFAASL